MENLFLAKTKDRETIIQHTEKLYKNFNQLKNLYPNMKNLDWDLLRIACLYHDLGKMNTKFQNKIIEILNKKALKNKDRNIELLNKLIDNFKQIEEIPHGHLSSAFLPEDKLKEIYSYDDMRILYQSIYFHHFREIAESLIELQTIINEDLSKYFNKFNYERIGKIQKINDSFMKYIDNRILESEFDSAQTKKKYIMTKGLLNKIDYSASANIDVEVKNDDLLKKTYKFLEKGGFKPNSLQQYMINHQDENNIIRASTGIGKTEAALFWIGNNKGFFTLPLKVSINAIFDRIINKIRFESKKTGLLHSDTYSEHLKRNNNELDIHYLDRTKQLSLPVTVCTLDQLVDFIFKYEGYELKLATLSYSKLVIDEIQMYSPELVGFLIVALKQINDMGGKFSIVTATLPPIFLYFIDRFKDEKGNKIEYNKPEPFYKENNGLIQLRHRIKVLEEDIDINHILQNYNNNKILVIVNTVKQAQKIYNDLIKNPSIKDKTKVNLFHSKFIKKDRTYKEGKILELGDLKTKDSGIWVTTQVVEASLDIDFDVLYTELSDMSGLLQRMGRVYRNRDLTDDITNIFIYTGKEKFPSGISNSEMSIIDKDIFRLSQKALLEYVENDNPRTMDEKDKMELVEKVYSVENLKDTEYFKKIKKVINKTKDVLAHEINKKDIRLRDIQSTDIIPLCVYNENRKIIDESLEKIEQAQKYQDRLLAQNKIRKFMVSIPNYELKNAENNACVIFKFELSKYMNVPVVDYDYSFEMGLIKTQFAKKVDNLIY